MQQTLAFRLTIGGEGNLRQYHLHSRWLAEVYVQTYLRLGKPVNIEQLVNGCWQPANI
ncbi:hypothetical protein [Desulfoscipio geothermicus]|nr:hypothetical protein [Desulfoscipio geothermicus]